MHVFKRVMLSVTFWKNTYERDTLIMVSDVVRVTHESVSWNNNNNVCMWSMSV